MEENQKFCLGLYSGSFDKLTMAGVMLSGAAADDMDVDIYVFIQGARLFRKGVPNSRADLGVSEYPEKREELLEAMKNVNTMEWIEFLEMAKELTNVKVHVCGLAGKMWGGEKKEDFIDLVDDIVGISEYITTASEADLNILL
jgi:peroxiredoxin family protein